MHRLASLAKRWLLGTHQGSVDEAHLPAYLNELAFRFNRRRSRSRGMVFYRVMELAAGHQPVRCLSNTPRSAFGRPAFAQDFADKPGGHAYAMKHAH